MLQNESVDEELEHFEDVIETDNEVDGEDGMDGHDDLETSCKTGHACTYVDTQVSNFYGHVMLGLRIYFPLF